MHFSIGQHIVHPAHGAGEITNIEHQELVEGYDHYYVVRFTDKRLTVRIPVNRTEDLGLRAVMSQSRLQRVLHTLRKLPGQLPANFKERKHKVEAMIQSGYPTRVAEAVRELTWRRKDAHLTKADRHLLAQGREMLVTEMALAAGTDRHAAQSQVDQALTASLAAKQAQLSLAKEQPA